jgi:hypothetical protein
LIKKFNILKCSFELSFAKDYPPRVRDLCYSSIEYRGESMEKYRVFAGEQKDTCNKPVHQLRRCQGLCCKNLLDSEEAQECREETGKNP